MKLIVRAPNWVGDAVMSLTAIDNIKEMTGASHLAVMARKATAPLFINHPDVDRVIEIDDKSSAIFGPKKAADSIRDEGFDLGILFPPSFSSALIFKLAKIPGRIGYASDKRSLLLTRAVSISEEPLHRVNQFVHLLETPTRKKADLHNPTVYLSHENIQDGEEVLKASGLSYDDSFVIIAPRAIAESRRWGSDNYGALAQKLTAQLSLNVILIGTSGDDKAAEEIRRAAPDSIINLCGQTSLLSAAAIMSFSKLFIGNDSGLAHLAGAVTCPLVVLSGADDPAETSPLCENKTVIIKDIDCISCVKNECPKKGDDFMRCMKLISVDEVLDAATKILSK